LNTEAPIAAQGTILVVDDDGSTRRALRVTLSGMGFSVVEAARGEEALSLVRASWFDAVLLDIDMPGMGGIETCRCIRRAIARLPILMLTVLDGEDDKVLALDAGADDYITKPFSPRELLARIQAVLRRAAPAGAADVMEVQGLKLDDSSHRVSAGEREIALGPTEYRLLHFFMTHPERVFSRGQLLDRVWGGNTYVEERTVDVHIRRLRKALEPYTLEGLVQTVRGAGYRFSTRDS